MPASSAIAPPPQALSSPALGGGVASQYEPPAFVNPYLGHRNLTETEQQVLGEYARLAGTIGRIAQLSTTLSSSTTHHALLSQLRVLERKMGLVLTLFKASVWSVVMTQQQHMEEAEAAALEQAQMHEEMLRRKQQEEQQGQTSFEEYSAAYQQESDGTLRDGIY